MFWQFLLLLFLEAFVAGLVAAVVASFVAPFMIAIVPLCGYLVTSLMARLVVGFVATLWPIL